MRWLLLLILPAALISWIEPSAKTGNYKAARQATDSGDTLKMDSLIFADFFSPNGDGHNDTYVIQNIETLENFGSNSLKVFNRWGEVVYLSSPYQNDWNGTNNQGGAIGNNQLTDGVYYFEFYDGKGDKATGKITLKR